MKKKMKISALLLLTIMALGCLSGCSTKTCDASKYANITLSGLNGSGKLEVELNGDAVTKDYYEHFDDEDDPYIIAELIELYDSFDFEVDKLEELENGDVINIKVVFDENIAKKNRLSFENAKFVYEVEGLAEPTALDPFDGIELMFKGISPNGELVISKEDSDQFVRQNVTFTPDYSSGLKNGDKVTVVASCNDHILEENAIYFEDEKKEFEVSGLGEYLTTVDSIDIKEITDKVFLYADERAADKSKWNFRLSMSTGKWDNFKYEIKPVTAFFKSNKTDRSKNDISIVYEVHAEGDSPSDYSSTWAKDGNAVSKGEHMVETLYWSVSTSGANLYVLEDKIYSDFQSFFSDSTFLIKFDKADADKNTVINEAKHSSQSFTIEEFMPEDY